VLGLLNEYSMGMIMHDLGKDYMWGIVSLA